MKHLRRGLPILAATLLLGAWWSPAEATWSVVAVDRESGQVIVASATCVSQSALRGFPSEGLMDIQAIVVPGVGGAVAQAGVDRSRENQRLIHRELQAGTHPREILEKLKDDPRIEHRQFAILDREGRSALFSGAENLDAAQAAEGAVPDDTDTERTQALLHGTERDQCPGRDFV